MDDRSEAVSPQCHCGREPAFVRAHVGGVDVWWGPACIQRLAAEHRIERRSQQRRKQSPYGGTGRPAN